MTVTNPRPLQAVLDGVELESGGLGGNPGMDGGASAGSTDLEYTVRAAAVFAGGMGLSDDKTILGRTLTRGAGHPSALRLPGRDPWGVFTDKLPNTRGLARGQINQGPKRRASGSEGARPSFCGGDGAPQGRRPRTWCLRRGRWVLLAASAACRFRSTSGRRFRRGAAATKGGRAPFAFGGGEHQNEQEREE